MIFWRGPKYSMCKDKSFWLGGRIDIFQCLDSVLFCMPTISWIFSRCDWSYFSCLFWLSIAIGREGGVAPLISLAHSDFEVSFGRGAWFCSTKSGSFVQCCVHHILVTTGLNTYLECIGLCFVVRTRSILVRNLSPRSIFLDPNEMSLAWFMDSDSKALASPYGSGTFLPCHLSWV